MTKKRKIFVLCLIIVVTALCVWLGFRTRYNNRIIITQLAGEGNGYIIETAENNLIVIDGGTENDALKINEILSKKQDSQILAWFLTSAENDKTGAICEILKNNPSIEIPNIYISFNSGEFYDNTNLTPNELEKLHRNLDFLYSAGNIEKLRETEKRAQYKFDNYYITPLEVKNEENLSQDISNQTVILKVDNTFKNAIFLGDIGDEKCHYFLENNQDQYDCDVLQISGNKINIYGEELFNKINPKTFFVSSNSIPSYVKSDNVYTKENGEITAEIW